MRARPARSGRRRHRKNSVVPWLSPVKAALRRGRSPSEVVPAVAGSGDKQAKAKLCRFEIEEVAVAFDPSTRCEVVTQAAHCPLLGVRPDAGPHRYSATD